MIDRLHGISKLTNPPECVIEYKAIQNLNVEGNPFTQVDAEFKEIVDLLNGLEGLATTDSCATHFNIEKPKKLMYIAFLVDDRGFDLLADLQMLVMGHISVNDPFQHLVSQIKLCHRLRMIAREFQQVAHIWTISVPIPNESAKNAMVEAFDKAVRHVTKDRGARPV